jgi:HAD superfamily hydrolase (TIGR01509 family)
MKDIELIIFDCDGVLIDSEGIVCRIAAEELTRLGYGISTEDVMRRFAGRPDGEMRAEIEAEWGQPVPGEYAQRVNARTEEAYSRELKAVAGVCDALDGLTLPVCVASSSFPEKLRLGLEITGLYDRFGPNVISAKTVAHGKPEGDVFIFAAGWMHVSPLKCLVIEDSVAGVRAARKAGMEVFGFDGAAHGIEGHRARLVEAGAALVFADMRELPALVRSRFRVPDQHVPVEAMSSYGHD